MTVIRELEAIGIPYWTWFVITTVVSYLTYSLLPNPNKSALSRALVIPFLAVTFGIPVGLYAELFEAHINLYWIGGLSYAVFVGLCVKCLLYSIQRLFGWPNWSLRSISFGGVSMLMFLWIGVLVLSTYHSYLPG